MRLVRRTKKAEWVATLMKSCLFQILIFNLNSRNVYRHTCNFRLVSILAGSDCFDVGIESVRLVKCSLTVSSPTTKLLESSKNESATIFRLFIKIKILDVEKLATSNLTESDTVADKTGIINFNF